MAQADKPTKSTRRQNIVDGFVTRTFDALAFDKGRNSLTNQAARNGGEVYVPLDQLPPVTGLKSLARRIALEGALPSPSELTVEDLNDNAALQRLIKEHKDAGFSVYVLRITEDRACAEAHLSVSRQAHPAPK